MVLNEFPHVSRVGSVNTNNSIIHYITLQYTIIHYNTGEKPTVIVYPPVLSTCPFHTNSGCGKREAHISSSMVT